MQHVTNLKRSLILVGPLAVEQMNENLCVEIPFVTILCDTLIIIIVSHLGFVLGCDKKTITCAWYFTNSLQSERV